MRWQVIQCCKVIHSKERCTSYSTSASTLSRNKEPSGGYKVSSSPCLQKKILVPWFYLLFMVRLLLFLSSDSLFHLLCSDLPIMGSLLDVLHTPLCPFTSASTGSAPASPSSAAIKSHSLWGCRSSRSRLAWMGNVWAVQSQKGMNQDCEHLKTIWVR